MRTLGLCVFVLSTIFAGLLCGADRFLPDDPLWKDSDNLTIAKPAEIEVSQIYDFVENSFVRTRNKSRPPAANANTLGEVPDSSWFTNRMGASSMSLEELVRGPNKLDGPDASHPWTIIGAKSQGISPGFTIKDARGDVYFVKFDPKDSPGLATSAEVICTKFFYAFGYNVPENYLATTTRKMLQISPETKITDEYGKKRRMTGSDVDAILRRVPVEPDGSVRVVASRKIEGERLGPFRYAGTRSDDANDVFPHEDRRELRGMRVFAAWLNHDDSRSINSLDFYVRDGDAGHVKHYLIDFGSTLGSGSVKPQGRRAGNEYIIEWPPIAKASVSFGLWDRPWRHIPYPFYESIGRFEANYFQSKRWKPEYPNPAFDRMDLSDAFWAVRIILRFSDEMIRAIVHTGQIPDPDAETYLANRIIQRRNQILNDYLRQINPLDEFQLETAGSSPRLTFHNLGVQASIGRADSYDYEWFRFDNTSGDSVSLGKSAVSNDPVIPVPAVQAPYLMVRIKTTGAVENWKKAEKVYIRNGAEKSVVGIEHE